jgi:hypothetical protein
MESLMPKYFIKIVFSIIITLTLYIPAHAGWIIYHKPALTVRIIDTHTKKPIKDAVVVVMYEKGPIISGPGGGSSQTFHAREHLTGENGEVHFPSFLTLMGPNSRESNLDFIIYKPGYIGEHHRKLTDDNLWIIELSKANTWKERRAASGVSIPDSVDNQLPILKEILKKEEKWLYEPKNREWVNYDSETALISIAKEGRINVAKSLIANGANVNYSTHVFRTALMEAAREGHSNMLDILLENRADVNMQSSLTGRTALMEAAREGYLTAVQLLIKAGADTNIKDIEGKTALIDAIGPSVQTAKKGSSAIEIVEVLIDGGADINYNRQGESALKLALILNRSKVVQ